MISYIIGAVLVIITLLIVGLILRKRIYDKVDQQEIWKTEIMNRNTAAELAKIKGLNLSGETQKKFESWKKQWEAIVTRELPEVEEWLFEAEDAADRYKFPTANKIVFNIEKKLNAIEEEINQMMEELDELLLSEKSSRKEVDSLKPLAEELHEHVVAHRLKFDRAQVYFIKELNKIEEKFLNYDELVELGNYIEGKALVDDISENLEALESQIKEYPEVLDLCSNQLPKELKDLEAGMLDMERDGYYLGHLGFKEGIRKKYQHLREAVVDLEAGSSPEIEEMIQEIKNKIKEMYNQLEQEAIAKNYIDTHISEYATRHEQLQLSFSQTKEEVEVIRKSYFLNDEDMEQYLQMDKIITNSLNQLDDLLEKTEENKSSYTELRDKIEAGFTRLDEIDVQHSAFKKKIRSLRKEELDAKEKLSKIERQIKDEKRKLMKSNLPGIPEFIWKALDKATKKNALVNEALEKQPLNMTEVQQALTESVVMMSKVAEQVEIMLDQAYLTEQVIQYANRYRSRDPLLGAKLSEAERLFRSYEYELSLEHAAKAIEEVEPGALKTIEANQASLFS